MSAGRAGAQKWLTSLQGYRRLKASPLQIQRLAFYSEGRSYWPHLGPLVEEIAGTHAVDICYVSSDPEDPGLCCALPRVHGFFIGDGIFRTIWFRTSPSRLTVMTMPDLDVFHVRKSVRGGQYAYVHHSMVSTHMIYRENAFDRFDAILCVGPHQVAETREREAAAGLPPKRLFDHGYGRLDTMLGNIRSAVASPLASEQLRVLVAPSWGENGLLERCGTELVAALLQGGIDTIVRPHPMTIKRNPQLLPSLMGHFANHPNFSAETEMASYDTLRASDVMISDWSGAALEFAFAFEKPVLFIDVPPKVRNPHYNRYNSVPLEFTIRERIGAVLAENDLSQTAAAVRTLHARRQALVQDIREARHQNIFNVGNSAKQGAKGLLDLLREIEEADKRKRGNA